MSTTELQKEINKQLATADVATLKAVKNFLSEYAESKKYKLTAAQKQLVEDRIESYKSGKSKTVSPSAIKKHVLSKLKK
jgi:putative addiction module component (TIGR02574 family)